MSYIKKQTRLVTPPPRAPLPCGSIYANPPYPCTDFVMADGHTLSLTFNDLRAILVHQTKEAPEIAAEDLRQAFRDSIRITPHTHSDVNIRDITIAYNTPSINQP